MIIKKRNEFIILLLIYTVTLGARIYWFSQKEGFYIDESLSFYFSFCKERGIFDNFETEVEYSGLELKTSGFISLNSGVKEAIKDIYKLWKDNKDESHSSLYYMLLRLFCINLKKTDVKYLIFRGCMLNLILFTMSFIYFYMLIKLAVNSKTLQYAALLCAFLSSGTISNTLFIREYQIQGLMLIIFVYYFIKTYDYTKRIIGEGRYKAIKRFIIFSVITAFALSTGYYVIIFIGLLGLNVIYIKCKEKKYGEIIYYIMVLVSGLALAQMLYHKHIRGYIGNRFINSIDTAFGDLLNNLGISVKTAVTLLYKFYYTLPVLILYAVCLLCFLCALLLKKKISIDKNMLYVFCVPVIFSVIVTILTPFKYLRYIMPVYPFFILLPVMIIDKITTKIKIMNVIAASLMVTIFIPQMINENRILYLYKNRKNDYKYLENKDIPVYFCFNREENDHLSYWMNATYIPYLYDEGQKYIFVNDYKDIENTPYDDVYAFLDTSIYIENNGNYKFNNFDIINSYLCKGTYDENNKGNVEYLFHCVRLKKNIRTEYKELKKELLQISEKLKGR
jgi:hypothetical protein